MTTKFIGEGKVIPYTAGADVLAGAVLVIGKTLGVATTDIANGAIGHVAIDGVFTCPKVSAAVFVKGENLIWDVSAQAFDDNLATPAAGDVSNCAVAWKAGANTELTCEVLFRANIGTVT